MALRSHRSVRHWRARTPSVSQAHDPSAVVALLSTRVVDETASGARARGVVHHVVVLCEKLKRGLPYQDICALVVAKAKMLGEKFGLDPQVVIDQTGVERAFVDLSASTGAAL